MAPCDEWLAPKLLQRIGQISAGLHLQGVTNRGRMVKGLAGEELREDFPTPLTEEPLGHPLILRAYLRLILDESRPRGPKYGQVDIDQELLILAFWQRGMTRGQDELPHPLYQGRRIK
jgi:hypothetical protein